MAKRGCPPDLKRQTDALILRREGLTLSQVAGRLGISRRAVHQLLGVLGGPRPIFCRQCGTLVNQGKPGMDNLKRRPVCLRCLSDMSKTTFGERLRALRLAQDLSREQLANAAGVSVQMIHDHENELAANPRYTTTVKLVRILGPALVGWKVG